jgi:hypothetical protein
MGSAQECSLEAQDQQQLVSTYNENVDKVPGVARSQVSGQRIDLRIETPDGERRFAVTTRDDGRIASWEDGAIDDPTLRVETDESTLCDIATSDDPAAAFSDAYDSGAIEVSGVGPVNAVKVTVMKIGVGVGRFLSGLL